jgi:hypothetical protein
MVLTMLPLASARIELIPDLPGDWATVTAWMGCHRQLPDDEMSH